MVIVDGFWNEFTQIKTKTFVGIYPTYYYKDSSVEVLWYC